MNGESFEEAFVGWLEKIVAPVDCAAQSLLSAGQVARAAGQQSQMVIKACVDCGNRQGARARRGELDGQRQAVQAPADVDEQGCVVITQRKSRLNSPCAVDKELDGLVAAC